LGVHRKYITLTNNTHIARRSARNAHLEVNRIVADKDVSTVPKRCGVQTNHKEAEAGLHNRAKR
jgi:hypothetical protein